MAYIDEQLTFTGVAAMAVTGGRKKKGGRSKKKSGGGGAPKSFKSPLSVRILSSDSPCDQLFSLGTD